MTTYKDLVNKVAELPIASAVRLLNGFHESDRANILNAVINTRHETEETKMNNGMLTFEEQLQQTKMTETLVTLGFRAMMSGAAARGEVVSHEDILLCGEIIERQHYLIALLEDMLRCKQGGKR